MEEGASREPRIAVVERPITPAVRAAIAWHVRRIYRSELVVCCVILLFTAVVVASNVIRHSSTQYRILNFVFGAVWILFVCVVGVVVALDANRTLMRNLRAGVYYSATGPLHHRGHHWVATQPRNTLTVIPYTRFRPGLIWVDGIFLEFKRENNQALAHLTVATVDYLPYGRILLAVRNASGRIVAHGWGYEPVDELPDGDGSNQ